MLHYKIVKRQIQKAIREAEEEARLRKEMEIEAKRLADLKARENMWKLRHLNTVPI